MNTATSPSAIRLNAAPGEFWMIPDFIDEQSERRLIKWLESVPVQPSAAVDPRSEFAFIHPVYDGVAVTSRVEACAGDPIWLGSASGRGVDVPQPLVALMELASEVVTAVVAGAGTSTVTPLSSVYVDRYPQGGGFVPHVDRENYSEHIVGISIGPGECTLRFEHSRHPEMGRHEFRIPPRSLYWFAGPLRHDPWRHSVRDVTGTRYALTMRGHRA